MAVDVLRPHTMDDTDTIKHKLFFSLSKPVPLSNYQSNEINEQPLIDSPESSDIQNTYWTSPTVKLRDYGSLLNLGSSPTQESSGQKLVIFPTTILFTNSRYTLFLLQ